jgi:hypothetical protein
MVVIIASAAGCAAAKDGTDTSEIGVNEQAVTATATVAPAPPPIVTRQDLIGLMTLIDDDIVTMDRLEAQIAGDFNSLASLALNLGTVAARLEQAASGGSQSQLLQATKQMQETQMSFNLQYLQLQNKMQNENRQYTAVSNIMKTRHDTARNSIANVR